jgi:hypothetical protein
MVNWFFPAVQIKLFVFGTAKPAKRFNALKDMNLQFAPLHSQWMAKGLFLEVGMALFVFGIAKPANNSNALKGIKA